MACYQTFIRGLLDLTDDIDGGEVVPHPGIVRYDGDDPYLVVAADKARPPFGHRERDRVEEGFWLGDAFASGGSTGYDHKKMGITARGAWESVKRHFREIGRDIQSEDFTAVGIGDMAGDVFGNGMLLSPPSAWWARSTTGTCSSTHPDPERSFEERKRLFELPRVVLGRLRPRGDLGRRRLRAHGQVDFAVGRGARGARHQGRVAQAERADPGAPRAPGRPALERRHRDVREGQRRVARHAGDKANDAVRVDASELRAQVIGEGGNLGTTGRGVEFALAGGRVNTDAIDNSGGVDCSDREVNIKILLDAVVEAATYRRSSATRCWWR